MNTRNTHILNPQPSCQAEVRPLNRPNRPTAADLAAEMRAQVVREIPAPPAFRNAAHRRHFYGRRARRLARLQADIQWFLDTHCTDDQMRQMALDAYRDQSHLLTARN